MSFGWEEINKKPEKAEQNGVPSAIFDLGPNHSLSAGRNGNDEAFAAKWFSKKIFGCECHGENIKFFFSPFENFALSGEMPCLELHPDLPSLYLQISDLNILVNV
ncbi:hypothetical protein CDAR_74131 [Caerostris darwini]|uniref:Uncharacterized protein n=1 Tax=Caerostris darwini TaxID=1538125 RepID=A0AAV4QBG1_9ARAC|nr:hypothetical protein CDAR_74131 [Caerostris darwini]